MENSSKINFHSVMSWIGQIWQAVQAKAEYIIEHPHQIFSDLFNLKKKLFAQYKPFAVSLSIFTVAFAWSVLTYRKQLIEQKQNETRTFLNTSHYQIEQTDENQLSGEFFRKHAIQLTKDTQHGIPIELTINSIIQQAQAQEEIDKQDKYFFNVYEAYMKTDSRKR